MMMRGPEWVCCLVGWSITDRLDSHEKGEGEAEEGEGKGVSHQKGLANIVGEEESTSSCQACRCWRLCSRHSICSYHFRNGRTPTSSRR